MDPGRSQDPDWLYVRTASMVRKIYIRKGMGVGHSAEKTVRCHKISWPWCKCVDGFLWNMGVSINWSIQSGWFRMETPMKIGWFGGSPISGNHFFPTIPDFNVDALNLQKQLSCPVLLPYPIGDHHIPWLVKPTRCCPVMFVYKPELSIDIST